MYRTVATEIWTDPKFRALPAPGKLMFIYLFTSIHAHVGGIYYLPESLVIMETGLKADMVKTLWDTLSKSGLARRDHENGIVWVVNMFKWQARGEKIVLSVAKHLLTLHNSRLVNEFLIKYPIVKAQIPPEFNPNPDTPSDFGSKEQEQYQENEQDKDSASSEAAPPNGSVKKNGKERKKSNGAHPEFLRSFGDAWKNKYSVDYTFSWAKEGELAKQILQVVKTPEECERLIKLYLADTDTFVSVAKHPLSILRSRLNIYRAVPNNIPASQGFESKV